MRRSHSKQSRAARRARSFKSQLFVEPLEERALLAASSVSSLADFSALTVDPSSYDASRILVRFRPEAEAAAHADLAGTELEPAFALVPDLHEVLLSPGVTVTAALAAYQADPQVLEAQPDYRIRLNDTVTPNDPQFLSQWDLNNYGQDGGTPGADIHAPAAWSVTTGSGRTVVAVIDTGIDYTHPELYQNIWINQAEIPASRLKNLVDVDGDGLITFRDLNNPINQGPGKIQDHNHKGYIDASDILQPMVTVNGVDTGQGGWVAGSTRDGDTAHADDLIGWNFVSNTDDPYDDNSHGTHVAGTIGAVGNNGAGVAGINWKIQLMPLKFMDSSGSGYTSDAIAALNFAVAHGARLSNNSWGGGGYSPELYAAIQNARNAGHIFVVAAGNDGVDVDTSPSYPASYNLDNVVSVAATDQNDQLAYFSNYGANTVQLAAPGVNILSTTPNNTYSSYSGTSMATPHVVGVLALVWDLHPDWTYRQVIDQVLQTVDPLPALQGKTISGGRLDAARAVGYSGPLTTSPPPTISNPPQPPSSNPPSSGAAYVEELYHDLLGRAADSSGLSYWVLRLQFGASRQSVALGIWGSAEHRGLQVDQYYVTFLHRTADAAGRAIWVNSFQNGASEVDVMRGFVTSTEYQAAHADAMSFVAGLFTDILGRTPDAVGEASWLQALAGGMSRDAVAQAVLTSTEAQRSCVDAYYAEFLHRNVDGSGEQYWMDLLQSGQSTLESVGTAILGSGEYLSTAQSRAGQ